MRVRTDLMPNRSQGTTLQPACVAHMEPTSGDTRNLDISREAKRGVPVRQRQASKSDREALYAEFQPLVRRLIRRYGQTPELRSDLEGEIYCRFCAFVEAYDPERGIPLRPYLVRQLTAATYTYARRQWGVVSREFAMQEAELDRGFGWEADPTGDRLHMICQQQVASHLPEAMERLPLRQRQVVIWRYYEERSFEEIAEMLGVQAATVRSQLRHGLNNLRKYVAATNLEA